MRSLSLSSPWLRLLLLTVWQQCFQPTNAALGGEMAAFDLTTMSSSRSHRQDVCQRYDAFRNGTVELKDALEGLKLNTLLMDYEGGYFHYDSVQGIDPDHPGLAAVLLDELARRGKFTWRDSFGVSPAPTNGTTWTEALLWGVESYDVNIDWWSQNLERMNEGVAFLKEWYDSSIILITKEKPEEISNDINMWNWLRPYEWDVWLVTVLTIILSGLVYQWLEWLADERQGRTTWEWWMQNWYLSSINFTQAYEYQPKTLAARIFGISMAIWSLVMTATYTANLASLLVDRKPQLVHVETLEEAAHFDYRVCTQAGTNADSFIETKFPSVTRIPKATLLDVYQGLHNGECQFAAEVKASWLQYQGIRQYNPNCDLRWVGEDRKVDNVAAGFATKVDAGYLCTSVIRDVLNWHLADIIRDGFLDDAWDREYARSQDIDCDAYRADLTLAELAAAGNDSNNITTLVSTDASTRRRRQRQRRQLLRTTKDESGGSKMIDQTSDTARHGQYNLQPQSQSQPRPRPLLHRILKAGGKGAAGGAVAARDGESGDAQKLTLEQMIGTFMLIWGGMAVALAVGYFNLWYTKYAQKGVDDMALSVRKNCGGKNRESTTTQEMSNGNRGNSNFDDDEGPQEQDKNVQRQLAEMRQTMLEFQTQMLEEQRKLQGQIQILVAASSASTSASAANAPSSTSTTAADSDSIVTTSGRSIAGGLFHLIGPGHSR